MKQIGDRTYPDYAEFDMYGDELPLGTWSYVVDDYGVQYGPGWWPFHKFHVPTRGGDSGFYPASIRLSPDTEFRAWRGQYVLVFPSSVEAHKAWAMFDLTIRKQGMGTVTTPARVEFDLRARTYTITHCPRSRKLRRQAEVKAGRILRLLLAGRSERRRGIERPTTAHEVHLARTVDNSQPAS